MRFGLLLLARSPYRSLALALILALVGGIALLFAWMTPSMQASELAVWQRLPAGLRVGEDGPANPSCVILYQAAAARRADSRSSAVAHPDLVFGDAALDVLGLRPPDGYVALADPVAATVGGFEDGDMVEIAYGPLLFQGRVAVGNLPTQLSRASDGVLGLDVESLPGYAPEADRHLCFGGSKGPTAAAVAADIAKRQRSDGLTSATTMFGALAVVAWTVVLTMATTGVLRRRRASRLLLAGLGISGGPAALLTSFEVPSAGLLGLVTGIGLTLWLRAFVLRMWTDPDLVFFSGIAFAAIAVGAWTIWCAALGGRR
ncbi:MAG: hypothetical protein V4515_10045 [Chloroflexota bacterium]